jgi:hypothetical protein
VVPEGGCQSTLHGMGSGVLLSILYLGLVGQGNREFLAFDGSFTSDQAGLLSVAAKTSYETNDALFLFCAA